ncbi:hypothetical protein C0V97_00800 [Asaia sp. W19]|uniref:type II toxin-antitoxin system PemK/MazF family toxin n=1 Tax=unclassified Asaia TaxID=2685023 RepID=UPI000F8D0760|nr:type II toxin-antitoxin system PemK/MazF family toxin [Asaia sp. W19]RUT27496.1 hypothetical protein C0V97_00800 [Asaia sp. W19]
MSLQYPPQVGDVLLCDYPEWVDNGDLAIGEMQKRRLVVVLHNRLPYRDRLVAVAPFSTTPPRQSVAYQCKVTFEKPPPDPFSSLIKWAKADMINTVSYDRLSLPYDGKDAATSRRKYVKIRLPKEDMEKIKRCVCISLGLQTLTP